MWQHRHLNLYIHRKTAFTLVVLLVAFVCFCWFCWTFFFWVSNLVFVTSTLCIKHSIFLKCQFVCGHIVFDIFTILCLTLTIASEHQVTLDWLILWSIWIWFCFLRRFSLWYATNFQWLFIKLLISDQFFSLEILQDKLQERLKSFSQCHWVVLFLDLLHKKKKRPFHPYLRFHFGKVFSHG